MSKLVTVTDNGYQKVYTTRMEAKGISVIVYATSDFGGGNLQLKVSPARADGDTAENIDDLTPGAQFTYYIGADMDVILDLTDSLDANILVAISDVM